MDIFSTLKDLLVKELQVKEEDVKLDALLTEDLGADSLAAMDLILALEEQFSIDISDKETRRIKTVQDIMNAIEKKLLEKERAS